MSVFCSHLRLFVLCTLLCGLFACPASLFAVEGWQTPIPKNGTLTLSVQDGILRADYDVRPDTPFLYGNRTRFLTETDLLFAAPLSLDAATERISFEARGLRLDGMHIENAIVLRPIVRDEQGELFYLIPRPGENLNPTVGAWNAYTTAGFYAGEAGAASQETYTVGGTPGNSRPDGALQLLGFRLQVTQAVSEAETKQDPAKIVKPVKGSIYLGAVMPMPLRIPFSEPYVYADAFLKEKGTYQFAVQVSPGFQAIPVREIQREVVFDPENPVSRKQRLALPCGPDGHYWIQYQISTSAGKTLGGNFLKHQVFGNPDAILPQPVDMTTAPAIGYLRVNPERNTDGVYAADEPLTVSLRAFPKGEKELTLRYTLTPYFVTDILESGERPITFTGDTPQNLTLELKKTGGYRAFRLALTLQRGTEVIDQRTYYLGRRNVPAEQHARIGSLTDRREVKKLPYNRLTFIPVGEKKAGQAPQDAFLKDLKDYFVQTSPFTMHHTYMVELNDFEVLPGVFDFSLLDAVLDIAADYGCKVTVRFAHADMHAGPYRWGKFSRQISAEGAVISMLSYGAYEVSDPELNKLWLDAYRALYDRYRAHTAFEGYYVMLPAGEWIVVDQPWAGTVAGYSAVAQETFRDYLRNTLKLDLPALNQRWGTTYHAWNEVVPPLPTFRDGSAPDLRMAWLDFCSFKAALGEQFWIPKAVNSIRSYDDNRVTIAYVSPSSVPTLYGKLDYGHNGGNHSLDRQGEFVDAWTRGGIGWITEPIHPHGWGAHNDPGRNGWVLDVSVWTMIAQAGAGGANLHVYYSPRPSMDWVMHQGAFFALDRFTLYKSVLNELHAATLIRQPAQTVIHQDYETLYAKHRTTFHSRLRDLARWLELLEKDGVPYAHLNAFPGEKYKLVVPNALDEVIAPESYAQYIKMVQEDGAKMVLCANTGKYVRGKTGETFPLLRALGITPPTGKYELNGEARATVTVASPLFPAGATLDFQTVATMRQQLASKEVISRFWQYPYRWIPETDYFGYYPGHQPGGAVLATFPDGGAAVSLHQSGKGEVLVFWGTPDISGDKLQGFMTRAAKWAGVVNPLEGLEVPHTIELTNAALNRHYGLFYQEDKFGAFRVKFPACPEGDFFADEMVSGLRIGHYSGKELREKGLVLQWQKGYSPLKTVRLIPARNVPAPWVNSYNENDPR